MIVYAQISSYIGLSLGAKHHYLELVWYEGQERKSEDGAMRLNKSKAAELTKAAIKDGYRSVRFEEGDLYRGFWSREDAEVEAKRWFLEKFDPEVDVLILGRSSMAQPQPVLLGPKDYKFVSNHLFELGEYIDWWERPERDPYYQLLDKVNEAWNQLHGLVERGEADD